MKNKTPDEFLVYCVDQLERGYKLAILLAPNKTIKALLKDFNPF
jgi:hypothetical protein